MAAFNNAVARKTVPVFLLGCLACESGSAVRFELTLPASADILEASLAGADRTYAVVVAATLTSRRLEILLSVYHDNRTFYEKQCDLHGPVPELGGIWLLPTAALPFEAGELRCDFGAAWPKTVLRDQSCADCFHRAVERHFDAKEASRWKPAFLMECEVPKGWLRKHGRPAEKPTAVLTLRGKSARKSSALDLPMHLTPSTRKPTAATACSVPLVNVERVERLRPGITEAWLRWHLDVVGIEHFFLYDNDGTLGPVLRNIENQKSLPNMSKRITYFPSFPSHLGREMKDLRPRRRFLLARVHVHGSCRAALLCAQPRALRHRTQHSRDGHFPSSAA
eukprot:TRINITY_DN32889_c0_g1_i2.p1 TRINITY_DN32889_c0_g1~~TRINITY_DN32889_c0_g1_i2.p1  ORF type:complete len:337 (-),score=43.46 TRINITY_DN32889_c0_g1_i2:571-1581(-)